MPTGCIYRMPTNTAFYSIKILLMITRKKCHITIFKIQTSFVNILSFYIITKRCYRETSAITGVFAGRCGDWCFSTDLWLVARHLLFSKTLFPFSGLQYDCITLNHIVPFIFEKKKLVYYIF